MKLMNVTIRGFRSIEDMIISLKGNGHKVLVGKNESGKSNILKALQLLSGGTFSQIEQKLMFAGNQPASVIFRFELEQDESVKCKDTFIKKFIGKKDINLTNIHTVESFYEENVEILYIFDINEKGKWGYSEIPNNIEISDNWHYVHQAIPNTNILANSYIQDSRENVTSIQPYLLDAEVKNIYDTLHNVIKDTLELQQVPLPCVYWEYNSKDYDLPHSINIDNFSQNPDVCQPLKQMFLLAGYQINNIQKAISDAKPSPNHTQSLLNKVSRKTQKHINANWKEYNKEYINVKIELQKDGDNIRIGIQDFENLYDFAQRSDGFRRFVSFLLLMAGKENSLILLDEPETGLHPSGAKDLRDLLIKLGEQNIIVYATHSISMIDTENVDNNLIIRKENENTLLEVEKEDGVSSGEDVYRALGYSIYNELKKKNILLEGYTDKKILKLFMQGDKWKEFGICYTGGVKNIKSVVSLLELGDREYFVLSDADGSARQCKKEINIKHWYTYNDLRSKAITLEDFYTKKFFNHITKSVLEENNITTEESLFEDMSDNYRLRFVRQNLYKMQSINGGLISEVIQIIKQKCAEQATKEQIDADKLEPVLNQLLEKIKSPPSAE